MTSIELAKRQERPMSPIVDTDNRNNDPEKGGLGVYQAISAVQMALARVGIVKVQENKFDRYRFRGIDDVYNALSPILAEHKLCILPRMVSRTCEERQSQKGGSLFYVTVDAEFDFVAASDGSRHTVRMYGEAMDRSDKATNKAMSAAYKYACFQTFCIPVEGAEGDSDADFHSHEVKSKQAPQDQKAKPETEPEPVKDKEHAKAKAAPKKEPKPKNESTKENSSETETEEKTAMSLAQLKAIQNLAHRRGVKDEALDQMCRDQYGVTVNELASADASAFIRHLQKSA